MWALRTISELAVELAADNEWQIRPLEIPPDSLEPASSTVMSINIFVRGVGVGLIHTENLMLKKLREVRENSGLELDEKEALAYPRTKLQNKI